jgi:hypothetical protein
MELILNIGTRFIGFSIYYVDNMKYTSWLNDYH